MKDLTNSQIDRANVLNNNIAIQELYKQLGFYGVMFDGAYRFTKQQATQIFEVDARTIERILEQSSKELHASGYELFNGERLNNLRTNFVTDINVGRKCRPEDVEIYLDEIGLSSKTRSLGIFTFKALLNIGMLITGSVRAKELRSAILNIVIDVLNKRLGGTTKYIN